MPCVIACVIALRAGGEGEGAGARTVAVDAKFFLLPPRLQAALLKERVSAGSVSIVFAPTGAKAVVAGTFNATKGGLRIDPVKAKKVVSAVPAKDADGVRQKLASYKAPE